MSNYAPLYKTESEENNVKQLDKVEAGVADIARTVEKKEAGYFNPFKGPLPRILTAIAYPVYKRGRKTNKFTVNNDCSSCGLCQRVCPRGVIRLENGKPTWTAKQCELCLACLHRCPTASINYGKKSYKNGRYVNPRVKLKGDEL